MLTTRQARTIRMLYLMNYEAGACWRPEEMFPGHESDPEYRRDMRAVRRLADDGILERIDHVMRGWVRLPQSALDAYDEWYRAKGWKLIPCGRLADH